MLRFAPSPTGDMHIGNLRVAILNHILSKQLNEDLVVRIEDTDKSRNSQDATQKILEAFKKIQEVDTSDVEFEPISLSNTWFREDSEPEKFDENKIIQNYLFATDGVM